MVWQHLYSVGHYYRNAQRNGIIHRGNIDGTADWKRQNDYSHSFEFCFSDGALRIREDECQIHCSFVGKFYFFSYLLSSC